MSSAVLPPTLSSGSRLPPTVPPTTTFNSGSGDEYSNEPEPYRNLVIDDVNRLLVTCRNAKLDEAETLLRLVDRRIALVEKELAAIRMLSSVPLPPAYVLRTPFATYSFDFGHLLQQVKLIRRLGLQRGLPKNLSMMLEVDGQAQSEEVEKKFQKTEAILLSMTPSERLYPNLIDDCRATRISKGSGTSAYHVHKLVSDLENLPPNAPLVAKNESRTYDLAEFAVPLYEDGEIEATYFRLLRQLREMRRRLVRMNELNR